MTNMFLGLLVMQVAKPEEKQVLGLNRYKPTTIVDPNAEIAVASRKMILDAVKQLDEQDPKTYSQVGTTREGRVIQPATGLNVMNKPREGTIENYRSSYGGGAQQETYRTGLNKAEVEKYSTETTERTQTTIDSTREKINKDLLGITNTPDVNKQIATASSAIGSLTSNTHIKQDLAYLLRTNAKEFANFTSALTAQMARNKQFEEELALATKNKATDDALLPIKAGYLADTITNLSKMRDALPAERQAEAPQGQYVQQTRTNGKSPELIQARNNSGIASAGAVEARADASTAQAELKKAQAINKKNAEEEKGKEVEEQRKKTELARLKAQEERAKRDAAKNDSFNRVLDKVDRAERTGRRVSGTIRRVF